MPLPNGFPPPPTAPPPEVPVTDKAWRDYHRAMRTWIIKAFAALP